MRPLILLTNDDGIASPGLRAAAQAVADLGELLIVAPLRQETSAGRSFTHLSDGQFHQRQIQTSHGPLPAIAIDAGPAPTVRWAVEVLAPRQPDLLIAGINYGENVGNGVTVSGTVGATIESAALGIPGLAVSLQTAIDDHFNYNEQIDFSTAAHFTRQFARRLLAGRLPPGVDLLKVDVPQDATPATPWRLTRVSRQSYFRSIVGDDGAGGRRLVGYEARIDPDDLEPDSDIYALVVDRVVAVAPVTIDLTANGRWDELATLLGEG
jgi:5'-nucleotidase